MDYILSSVWINELLRQSEPSLLDFGSRSHTIIIPNQPHLAQSRAWHIGASLEPHVDITNFQRIGANRLLGTRALTFSSPNLGFTSFMILSNAEHALIGPIKLFNGHAAYGIYICANFTSAIPILTSLR